MNWLDPVYAIIAGATAPWWARKARSDWSERFGKIAPVPDRSPGGLPRLLIHTVSVGETAAIRELVPLLTPHAHVIISAATDTGLKRARELYGAVGAGGCDVVRYPLDASWAVRRFLDATRPDAVALVELELWPNFIAQCRRRGIPVGVINGRLSANSFKGYRRLRPFFRGVFGSLEFAAVQDDAYAERFIAMGVPRQRVTVTGSMKWDTARIEDKVSGAEDLARDLGIDRSRASRLVVAGSTSEGEERLLHEACGPDVQLLCAPRKPERFDDAAAAMPNCIRRSKPASEIRNPQSAIRSRFLLDTIGELRKAYALADVVVVGRTFGGPGGEGGSDPIEPIGLGKATVVGPAIVNFASVVETFEKAHALVRAERAGLAQILSELLADPDRREDLARCGRDCIRAQQGASRRHADMLLSMLARRVPREAATPAHSQV